jgi:TM2 domain-containing membrane protein YozV
LCSLVLPGAGQAYNGHAFKALFFFLFSPLVVLLVWSIWGVSKALFFTPLILFYIWNLIDAYRCANKMVAEGGRYGTGGLVWVFLQGWMAFNVSLFVLIVLTIAGVLK